MIKRFIQNIKVTWLSLNGVDAWIKAISKDKSLLYTRRFSHMNIFTRADIIYGLRESFESEYLTRMDVSQVVWDTVITRYPDSLLWIDANAPSWHALKLVLSEHMYVKFDKSEVRSIASRVLPVLWVGMFHYDKKICNEHPKVYAEIKCGDTDRTIYIDTDRPDIIRIGCFSGTEEEAIKAIKNKYGHREHMCTRYCYKVRSCFAAVRKAKAAGCLGI